MSRSDKTDINDTVVVHKEERRRDFVRRRVTHHFPVEEKRTKESEKEGTDINRIVNRAKKGGGLLPELIRQDGRFGDFTDVPSYHEAANRVAFANQQFQALSAEIRDRFNHDPARFLEFANDPKNAQEMINLGLATKRPEPIDPDTVLADKIGQAVVKHGSKKASPAPKGDGEGQA